MSFKNVNMSYLHMKLLNLTDLQHVSRFANNSFPYQYLDKVLFLQPLPESYFKLYHLRKKIALQM